MDIFAFWLDRINHGENFVGELPYQYGLNLHLSEGSQGQEEVVGGHLRRTPYQRPRLASNPARLRH